MRESGFDFRGSSFDLRVFPKIVIGKIEIDGTEQDVTIHGDYKKLEDNEHEKVEELLSEDGEIKDIFGDNARLIKDEQNVYHKTHVIILRKLSNPLIWKKVDSKEKIAKLRKPKGPFAAARRSARRSNRKTDRGF